jgi:Beta xylosidase C-terminal Concanavalin A-like domain
MMARGRGASIGRSCDGRVRYRASWVAAAALWLGTVEPVAAQTSQPFSDDFTQDKALPSGWVLSQPNPKSSYSIGVDGLKLDASGENGGSDLWSGTNFNASLLLQPISPASDWDVTAHFCFSPIVDFQAAGIVLATEISGFTRASQFHRFELSYQNMHNGLAVASYTNGPIDAGFVPYSGAEIFLRLTKTGNRYGYQFSSTGVQWVSVATIIDVTHYRFIGVDAIRQPWHGGQTLSSRPVFKSFSVDAARDDSGCVPAVS